MTDLEQLLQHAFDTAAASIPISADPDPWRLQQELIKDHRRRPRRDRPWLWVGLTATSVCLLLVSLFIIVPAVRENGSTPPAHQSSIPAPTGPATPEAQFTRTYLHRCLAVPQIASDFRHDRRLDPRGAIVRLVRTDQYGQVAVITKPNAIATCEVDLHGQFHMDDFVAWLNLNPRQLDAPITDEIGIPPRPHGVPKTEGAQYSLTAGRVASDVAGVSWVVSGRTVARATVGNGVYVIRVAPTSGSGQFVARDISGRVIWDESSLPLKRPIPWP